MMVGIARFGSGSTGDMSRTSLAEHKRCLRTRPVTFPVVEHRQAASIHSVQQSKMVGLTILFWRVSRLSGASEERPGIPR